MEWEVFSRDQKLNEKKWNLDEIVKRFTIYMENCDVEPK